MFQNEEVVEELIVENAEKVTENDIYLFCLLYRKRNFWAMVNIGEYFPLSANNAEKLISSNLKYAGFNEEQIK